MPKRLIEPAWRTIKAPITLKSLLLFLVTGFIVYTVLTDYQQRQASFERYKAIARYTEESRAALDSAQSLTAAYEQSAQNTVAMLEYMKALNRSMSDVADILRRDRQEQSSEHDKILRSSGAAASSRTRSQRPSRSPQARCYELQLRQRKYGDTTLVVREYVEVKCRE